LYLSGRLNVLSFWNLNALITMHNQFLTHYFKGFNTMYLSICLYRFYKCSLMNLINKKLYNSSASNILSYWDLNTGTIIHKLLLNRSKIYTPRKILKV